MLAAPTRLLPRWLLAPGVLLVALTATLASAEADSRRTARGVDVSHWQGRIDWRAVREDGVVFAFIKATEGRDLVDPNFARNWGAARQAGVKRGAYHFYRPNVPASVQARHFLRTVSHGAGDLPPVLDVEVTGGATPAQLRRGIRTWLEIVERETGKRPIVYVNPRVARYIDPEMRRHALWIAHYRATQPPIPGDWTRWTFWQYSSSGRVDGIRGRVDLNRYRGTLDQLQGFIESQGRRHH